MTSDLQRFVEAQEPVYQRVLAELRDGDKRSHWMWFVFPQIAGLGRSETSRFYALRSLAEAVAYAGHPVLGARLRECTATVNAVEGRTASQIFGFPDDMKFQSCMTLFERATGETLFTAALDTYFAGRRDPATLEKIEAGPA